MQEEPSQAAEAELSKHTATAKDCFSTIEGLGAEELPVCALHNVSPGDAFRSHADESW